MTSALDEMVQGIAPMISSLDGEDRIKTQDRDTMEEVNTSKTDITGRLGHPGTGVVEHIKLRFHP